MNQDKDYQDFQGDFEGDLFEVGLLLAICKRLGISAEEIADAYEMAKTMHENALIDEMAKDDEPT